MVYKTENQLNSKNYYITNKLNIMKHRILSFIAGALVLAGCDNNPKYRINGTVKGLDTAHLYLVAYAEKNLDTLNRTIVKNGKFSLSGTTDKTQDAFIVIKGQRGGFHIILENADFKANIDIEKYEESKITGTPSQDLLNRFNDLTAQLRKKSEEMQPLYMQAVQDKNEEKIKSIVKEFEDLAKEISEKRNELIKANPDNNLSLKMFLQQISENDPEKNEEIYAALSEDLKNSEEGKKAKTQLDRMAVLKIGAVAPNFSLPDPKGNLIDMHSIKGKVKLLDFWASWCGPCRNENPNVVNLYNKFHHKGFEILGISLDTKKENWEKAIKDDKLTWHHVSDLKGWENEAAQLYMVQGIPATFLLDADNKIVAVNLRGEELQKKVAELLK